MDEWLGRGCELCRGSGLRGRVGVFELLPMSDELRREILSHRGSEEIAVIARANGMRTMRDDGLAKVSAGLTTRAEVERATQET